MKNKLKNVLKNFKISCSFYLVNFFISEDRKKKFTKDFNILLKKLNKKENFAFSRFSDGELFILQNKKLIISLKYWLVGDKKINANFSKDDQKEFLPSKHQFYRQKLISSLTFKKKNYFKGISCTCCNGKKQVKYMKYLANNDINLTFSNLLQNGNYHSFMEKMLKIFSKKKIILIANKNHNHLKLPFKVKKKFSIGINCFINDYSKIKNIKNFIRKNKIKNHIFLFQASSLSNILIYELFRDYDKNTYIDIGSTLNPYYNESLLSKSRSYLSEYWLRDRSSKHLKKKCYW